MYYCLKLVKIAACWKDLYCYKPDLELRYFIFFFRNSLSHNSVPVRAGDTIVAVGNTLSLANCELFQPQYAVALLLLQVFKTDSGRGIWQRKTRQ